VCCVLIQYNFNQIYYIWYYSISGFASIDKNINTTESWIILTSSQLEISFRFINNLNLLHRILQITALPALLDHLLINHLLDHGFSGRVREAQDLSRHGLGGQMLQDERQMVAAVETHGVLAFLLPLQGLSAQSGTEVHLRDRRGGKNAETVGLGYVF
jgi:hypothetical protein